MHHISNDTLFCRMSIIVYLTIPGSLDAAMDFIHRVCVFSCMCVTFTRYTEESVSCSIMSDSL